MKSVKILLALTALAVFAGVPAVQAAPDANAAPAAQAKPEVKIKYKTTIKSPTLTDSVIKLAMKNNTFEAINHILDATPDKILDIITATGKMEVIPCDKDLETCINAVESGDSALAGADQALVAKFRSINYPITIKFDDYQDRKRSLKSRGKLIQERTIRLGASVKMLDAQKGIIFKALVPAPKIERRIVVTEGSETLNEGGNATEKIFSVIENELCKQIAFGVVELLYPARIIDINKKNIVLDKAKGTGIKKGQVYVIYKRGKEIFDPDTGVSKGFQENEIALAKVTRVNPNSSTLKVTEILDDEEEISVGDIARLQEKDEDEDEE